MPNLDISVVLGTDDAYTESKYSTIRLTESELMLDYKDTYYHLYARFQNVGLAATDTINHAYLALRAYTNPSTSSALRILGIKEANTVTFSTYANAEGRAETTAIKNWTAGPWAWNGVYGYLTDPQDIAAIITEIKNQVGWASGNALALKVKNTSYGSEARSAASYETGGGYQAPALHIEYTPGAVTSKRWFEIWRTPRPRVSNSTRVLHI